MLQNKKRIQLVINSANRNNPNASTTSNFTFSPNEKASRINEVSVEFISIPFSFYTINSSNNVLTFNSAVHSITITPGNYTMTNLITEMQTKLLAVPAFSLLTPTVTFSYTTYKVTISMSSAFIVDSKTAQPTSTFAPFLGFSVSSVSNTTATANNVINISGGNYLYVVSNYLSNNLHNGILYSNGSYDKALTIVPINTSPGGIILYQPNIPIRLDSRLNIRTTDLIDITIYDEYNNIIDLNGQDIAINLLLFTD
jgi:hypothetical protein